MSRFIVTLTDEEQAMLEAKRADLGLRSKADVIRYWLALGYDNPHSPQWSEREVAAIKALGPQPPLELNRIKSPKPSPVSRGKLDTVTERVSFGPVESVPGSRLKKR